MVGASRSSWRNTTHDWATDVDLGHLARIQGNPAEFAPGGVRHLILEVLAHPADEAASTGAGRCTVTLHLDGSVSVADEGRGTDTRFDEQGRPVKKPVMSSKTCASSTTQARRHFLTGIRAAVCPSSPRSASGSSTPTAA